MNHAPQRNLDDALREALKPAPAPEALRARLLAKAGRPAGPWSPLRATLLAAAAVVVVGLGALFATRMKPDGRTRVPLATAVSGASADFSDTGDLSFLAGACTGKGCGDWAKVRAGFRAPLPACFLETDLAGGGTCRIAGTSTVHYALRDGSKVYVFQGELTGCAKGRRVVVDQGDLQAQAWNEEGHGYLLLAKK